MGPLQDKHANSSGVLETAAENETLIEKKKRRVTARELTNQTIAAASAVAPANLTRSVAHKERPVEHAMTATASDSTAVLALVERIALDPRAHVKKLEALTELYQRLQAREAKLAFNAAKARILKKLACIKIVKTRSVLHETEKAKPQTGTYEPFGYAPLEKIDKHLRPLLGAEDMDLSYSDEPLERGGILVRGRLKHLPSGH
jgi:hypothetical protein